MEPIRILHMIGSLNMGGSQMLLLNLYRNLDRSLVQFDLVLDHPLERTLEPQFTALGARIYTMPHFRLGNGRQLRSGWDSFFKAHPEYKVLHCHVRSYAAAFLPVARKHGVKIIMHSHNISNGHGPKAWLKAVLQYPLRYQADAFFSCSEEAGKWLFGKKILSDPRHRVVKNGICAEEFRWDPALRSRYRRELSLENKRVYLHVGRFAPQKNHRFLLRVFRMIRQRQEHAVLLLAGDGENREALLRQIRRLRLQEDVRLLGNRQDVAALLQAADVFLFPSKWEGLGIAAVEAQAAGLPCLCSEAVPSIVGITPDCRFLPLREKLWVTAALNTPVQRQDRYEAVVKAGYSAEATAQWLQDYYLKFAKEKRYLFASAADLGSDRLTGAHRRFLELLYSVAERHPVVFAGIPTQRIEEYPNITRYPISLPSGGKLPHHVAGFLAIYRVLRRQKREMNCDYAISFSPVTTICYRLAGIRHIVTLLREDLIGYQKALCAPRWKLAYWGMVERLAVKASEKIIVQCQSDRENLLLRNKGFDRNLEDKIHIQLNNANASWMTKGTKPNSSHREAPVFLFAGNFSDPRKGHSLLLPAAMKLLEEGYAFTLLCAGDGRELDHWQQRCRKHPAIRFLGHVSDLGACFAQADALLVPSLIDSCPNVILEGLQAGVAVYGSQTGGIVDLLQQKEYLFPVEETGITAFLRNVLETGRWRTDAVAQRQRKEALCFDWAQKIQDWIQS